MRTLRVHTGDEIRQKIADAILLATEVEELVVFNFNGIDVVVSPESDPDRTRLVYMEKLKRRHNH